MYLGEPIALPAYDSICLGVCSSNSDLMMLTSLGAVNASFTHCFLIALIFTTMLSPMRIDSFILLVRINIKSPFIYDTICVMYDTNWVDYVNKKLMLSSTKYMD